MFHKHSSHILGCCVLCAVFFSEMAYESYREKYRQAEVARGIYIIYSLRTKLGRFLGLSLNSPQVACLYCICIMDQKVIICMRKMK